MAAAAQRTASPPAAASLVSGSFHQAGLGLSCGYGAAFLRVKEESGNGLKGCIISPSLLVLGAASLASLVVSGE